MSQRNPMNDRYTRDDLGSTRKSAASAKPKSKAASSVVMGRGKVKPAERKAEEKKLARERRREESARQREIDKKYYKPDTERYKKLRIYWWCSLGAAVVFTAASWFLRGVEPEWLAFGSLILAYLMIILAFYIDFSKIRKERKAYQTRMLELELEEAKAAKRAEAEAARAENKKKHRRRH